VQAFLFISKPLDALIMKKLTLYIILYIAAKSLVSCTDSWDESYSSNSFVGIVNPTLSVDTDTLTFSDQESSQSLSVTSNSPWTAYANASWLTLSGNLWSGSASLAIAVKSNTNVSTRSESNSQDYRTATITLSNGVMSKDIIVKQANKIESLQASVATLSFSFSGGDKNVLIQSNVSWSVSSNASWLSVKKNSEGTAFSATASQNISTTARQAIITVKGVNSQSTITVNQSSVQVPSVSDLKVSNITKHEADCAFTASSADLEVSEYGIYYSNTATQPDNSNGQAIKETNGGKNVSHVFTLTGLSSKTTYYLRPYVVTSLGTQYGKVTQFTTLVSSPNEEDNGTPKD